MNARILAQKAEMDAINTEIQGMIALNQYRIARNETIAYDEGAFYQKAEELREIRNFLEHYWRNI